MFPDIYLNAIENYVSNKSLKSLSDSFKKLSQGYRTLNNSELGSSKEDVEAYLVGRLPVTWSVLTHLLRQISLYLPEHFSVLDYGSGPGTALLALDHLFESKRFSYLGLEAKKPMLNAAEALNESLNLKGTFKQHDVNKEGLQKATLAIVSYLLNELPQQEHFFNHLLNQHEFILLIEPGTPDGYSRLMNLRNKAMASNWHILAPCPHAKSCPLVHPDWCHFYVRVQRNKLLKDIKGGSMGYEDEKFSYLFLSRTLYENHRGVVIKKPDVYPYKVELEVCSFSGQIEKKEILKKEKELFKKAKKTDWGDFI